MGEKIAKFTKTHVEALKPRAQPYVVATGIKHLSIRVMPSGQRSYFFLFRFPSGRAGKERSISRSCEKVTVAEITRLATRWNGLLADGIDPRAEIESEAAAAVAEQNAMTFEKMARLCLADKERTGARTVKELRRVLDVYVLPHIGKLTRLERSHALKVFENTKENHGETTAHRAYVAMRSVFAWMLRRDPEFSAPNLARLSTYSLKAHRRSRELSDRELRALWKALEGVTPFGQFVKLLVLTAQRRSELLGAKWREIEGNLWRVPAERDKLGVGKVVPLSIAALDVLGELPKGKPSDFVFTTTFGQAPFSGTSKAKTRLDAEMLRLLREDDPEAALAPWVLHDLRRVARSWMARAGVRGEIAERVLGHAPDGIEATYNLHDHLPEKTHALEALAREISAIIDNVDGANVVAFPMRR